MPNVFFQGAELAMSSGVTPGVMANIQRLQDVRIDYQIPRTEVRTLGRFKPLNDRPVINYTPVNMSVSYAKSNKDVERNLGILNSTGVAVQIGQNTEVTNWGCRNYTLYNAPVTSPNYANEWDIVSGVLKSFALNGSVGQPVNGSFTVEAFDLQQAANNGTRTIPSYSGNVIKPENITITGINFTGLGFSGLIVQSFNLQTAFNYAQTFRIGTKYPERRMTDAMASLQISAFMEGTTNTVTSLNQYDCGTFITGLYVMTLQPSCTTDAPTTITLSYPYLESQSLGTQVGNYTAVELGFVAPLSIVAFEATGANQGSNLTIT
jgi:hypothetical protein